MTSMVEVVAHLQDVSELAVAVGDVGVSPTALCEGFDDLEGKFRSKS